MRELPQPYSHTLHCFPDFAQGEQERQAQYVILFLILYIFFSFRYSLPFWDDILCLLFTFNQPLIMFMQWQGRVHISIRGRCQHHSSKR